MLLILMYHRVNDPATGAHFDLFKKHLEALISQYPIVAPGDPLPKGELSICLTFDDAFFDFYHDAFPLLQSLQCPATLAVPVKYILDSTELDTDTRLGVPYPTGLDGELYKTHAPFCTWEELKEMSDSGLITMASHSYSHAHMDNADTDLTQEMITSKEVLSKRLDKTIDSFVYPFGDMDKRSQQVASQHYRYCMRIGSALNRSWSQNLLYRVDAESFWKQDKTISAKNLRKFKVKYWSNRLRGK